MNVPRTKHSHEPALPPNSFSSGLTVDEFLLVDAAGFAALALVAGGSAFHIGWQASDPGESKELEMLTQALYGARRSAMQQLEGQAKELNADGIIGVQLEIENPETSFSVLQVIGYGTAVRHHEATTSKPAPDTPFSTTLSGQDFWALREGGYHPLRIVMGSSIYQVGQARLSWLASLPLLGKNTEVSALTEGIYDARESALQRMEDEAHACRAEGIVGVKVEVRHHTWEGNYIIEFFALGTAIVASKASSSLLAPLMAIDLRL
jgi:uncharacterized protein YbjQ (UPF0145 family)